VQELRKAREDAGAKAALATEQALAAAKAAEERAKAAAQAAELAAARAAAKPSQDIIEWLGNATLSGVRISETSSKLILNGKAYSPGEYVNFSLGIKVMVIQENRVLFTDNMGKKYMKRL
jgi:membrane protein involved in colicin uptake